MYIQALPTAQSTEALSLLAEVWGTTCMVLRGEPMDLAQTQCLNAHDDAGALLGSLTYRPYAQDALELTSLACRVEGKGVGTALLRELTHLARERGCKRIVVITTNDNLRALCFYQKRGFDMARLYRGAMERVRLLKPEVPLLGENGIPLRHEIELEMDLTTLSS